MSARITSWFVFIAPKRKSRKGRYSGVEVFQHTAIQMFILAVIVICGFIARKKSLMNDTFDTMLSQLVFNITLPALILNSVLSSESLPSAHDIGFTLLYAAL